MISEYLGYKCMIMYNQATGHKDICHRNIFRKLTKTFLSTAGPTSVEDRLDQGQARLTL